MIKIAFYAIFLLILAQRMLDPGPQSAVPGRRSPVGGLKPGIWNLESGICNYFTIIPWTVSVFPFFTLKDAPGITLKVPSTMVFELKST